MVSIQQLLSSKAKSRITFLSVCMLMFLIAQQLQAQTNTFPSSGNVGIGTTLPSSELHLKNGVLFIDRNGQSIKTELNSNADYSRFMFNGTDHYLISYGSNHSSEAHKFALKSNHNQGSIGLFTTNIERFSISPSGYVGIGTTSPTEKLHVAGGNIRVGTFTINDSYERFLDTRQRTVFINDTDNDQSSTRWDFYHNSTDLDSADIVARIAAEGNTFFLQEGNFGIGTDNPTSKLTVNGTAKAEEIIVEENIGADFVFEENYKLPSLLEVEEHIKSKKHLPDMPSAEEMISRGVRVGKLQMKLLQKIEELTLYVIEQQKQLNNFREVNGLQQKEIDLLKKQLKIIQERYHE